MKLRSWAKKVVAWLDRLNQPVEASLQVGTTSAQAVDFLSEGKTKFQICSDGEVLYHMQNLAELASWLAHHCSKYLLLWTYCYDADLILSSPWVVKFNGSAERECQGFHHTLHRQKYQASLIFSGFCGGSAPTSCWTTQSEILRCLDYFALVAKRRSS